MKKKLLLFIVLLLSAFSFVKVNAKVADVSIKKVELQEINGTAEEVDTVRFSGMNINYNVIFKQVEDSVKYKVTIQNRGDEDIYINSKGEIDGSNYVIYEYDWDDNQNLIKGHTEKTFTVAIIYNKEVEAAQLSKGKYVEAKEFAIKISDQKGNILPAKNPHTDSNLSIFIILLSIEILMIMGVTIYLIKNKKLNIRNIKQMKKANMISAGVFLILVLGTIIGYSYALESAEINVGLKVGISKARLARSCYSDSYALEHPYHNDYGPLALRDYPEDEYEDYEYDYCLDWNYEIRRAMPRLAQMNLDAPAASEIETYANVGREAMMVDEYVEPYADLITTNTKNMQRSVIWYEEKYNLMYTSDVSDMQNGEVILGVYMDEDYDNYLLIIGQDGGVLAPVDSSWLFGNSAYIYEEDVALYKETEDDQNEGRISVFDIPKEEINSLKYIDTNIMSIIYEMRLDKLDVSDTNNMSGMFAQNGAYSNNHEIKGLNTWNTSSVRDMSGMFFYLSNEYCESKIEGLSSFNTSKVENMNGMFSAVNAKIGAKDLSNWDTSKVKDMSGLFIDAFNNLVTFDISKWNTSNVTNMEAMFTGSFNNLKKFDLSNWDVSKIDNMLELFYGALNEATEFDVSNWDVSNVTTMDRMFCYALWNVKSLDLSKWDTSNVEDMSNMFSAGIGNITKLDLSNWNVENVKTTEAMFLLGSDSLEELNLSNWNLKNVENIANMFNSSFGEASSTKLYLNNIEFSKFDAIKDFENYKNIFYGVPNDNITIIVKDQKEIDWILSLDNQHRPATWNENNVVVEMHIMN